MNEFNQFLKDQEAPPQELYLETKRDIVLSFRKKSILSRFVLLQLFGAALSLTFCPQFGMGLMKGHGIIHIFRMAGDWVCATYCGTLFLSAGMMVAFIGMKGEELWWIWNRYRASLIFLPPILWAILMLFNLSFNLQDEVLIFHVFWILTAILAQSLWFQLRTSLFLKQRPL